MISVPRRISSDDSFTATKRGSSASSAMISTVTSTR